MERKSFLLIFFAFSLVSTLPAQQLRFQKNHPLSAKDTIRDNSIMVPEDMERNYDQLLFDWNKEFLPSRSCFKSSDDNIVYPDSVYINRLYALPTLMEMAYNQVTRAYIDMYTNRRRTQVEYMLAIGKYYFPIFEQALDKYNVPMELKYLPVIESALNPTALSRAGASGLWQFMAPTGKRYDMEVNSLVDERRDPIKATDAAARYLKDLYKIYGDWNLVIAAYNCGPGNVNKAIRRSGGKRDYWEIYPYLPRETRGYVPAFIAANYVMNYYKYHNLCPLEYSEKDNTDTILINKNVHFQQISDVLNIPIQKIREMNPQFKNDIIPGEFHTYAICLPTTRVCDFISNKDSILAYKAEEFLVHRKIVNFETKPENDFVTRTVYYKVKRGEALADVARRHGVSVNELKAWNKIRTKRLASGRLLAIKTQVRVHRPDQPKQKNESEEEQENSSSQSSTFAQLQAKKAIVATESEESKDGESPNSFDSNQSETANSVPEKAPESPKTNSIVTKSLLAQKEKTTSPPKAKEEKKAVTEVEIRHKISSGETLYKVADQYKISVEDIREWNKLNSSTVKVGQELIIHSNISQADSHLAAKGEHSGEPIYHKVSSRETLGKIAEHYNVSVADITKWNNLTSSVVKTGQELIVQPADSSKDKRVASKGGTIDRLDGITVQNIKKSHRVVPKYYSVKKGDTLVSIAEKYSIASVREIKVVNNLKSDKLSVGQKLKIPTSAR